MAYRVSNSKKINEEIYFLKLLYICHETNKIVPLRIIAVNGLSHKKLNDPSLISNDLLRFSSIIPPKTKARIKGGIGKLYSLKKQASTPNPIIRNMSKVLKDIK